MRVLVFGASSAQGYWDSQGGWVDRLKHYYDELQIKDTSSDQPKVMNLGVSGDTTKEILKRIEPESKARQNEKGQSFIVQVGSNNAAEENGQLRTQPKLYESDLEQIIQKAKKYSDKVLVVGFPAVDEKRTTPIPWANLYYRNSNISKIEQIAQSACKRFGVPFVPVHAEFKQKMDSGAEMHAWDGLHPNYDGHELIFKLVQPELDKLLENE